MQKKEVVAYVIETEEFLQFESMSWAAEYFNVSVSAICVCLKGYSKTIKGCCFVFDSENYYEDIVAKMSKPNLKGQNHKKPVLVTDKNGNKIGEYSGIIKAAKTLKIDKNVISQAVNGIRTHKVYNFKFI